ncbi:MAG: hypothetical protein E7465_05515 [Ruminococcaceae bacterium]|nr:hypothetical protein [Oscillospiraceae bacterium]
MKTRDLFAKLFVTDHYFTIAIRKRPTESIVENPVFAPEFVVPASRQHWCADPVLVDDGEKTWLFYEAVLGDHGHIEVAQVLEDCTLGKPTVLLKDECHYSYPFVFRYENTWYMIPESSAASQVRLYRAVAFPEKWEPVTVLLREKAVDTTVFAHNGQLYLLTYLPDAATERVTPGAYKLNLPEGTLTDLPWEEYDELRVRGAGPVFAEGQTRYRPAQISREQRYGDGLVFYRITDPAGYREEPGFWMGPEHLRIRGCYADGLHTYCRSERFEAIDIRVGTVDFAKPFKKLFGK